MKPLFPVYCRPMGYIVMALALFLPMILMLMGRVTDDNLLFYKECSKLLMMTGAVLILFAYSKFESKETEAIRNKAVRNAIFITVFLLFGRMLWRVATRDVMSVDTSSFFVFLIVNVLCLEFGIQKSVVNRLFKRDGR